MKRASQETGMEQTEQGQAVAAAAVLEEQMTRKALSDVKRGKEEIFAQIGKRIIGQKAVIEHLLTAMLARGHCLFVGVPGLAKTMLVNTLSEVCDLKFQRIQFTPDLMPSDITGTDMIEEDRASSRRSFRFVAGPVFCNILLADEINRTPPKTQAALLQAMQEYGVTVGGNTYLLERPFHVFATQNPIEQEGTYPLPEAQLDRFMFMVNIDYPSETEEMDIVRTTTSAQIEPLRKIISAEKITALQDFVPQVPASRSVVEYAVRLVRSSRPSSAEAPLFVKEFLSWGAGPRASQYLILGGKARALLSGRYAVSIEDVAALAKPVLQHRLITNFHAEASGVNPLAIIDRLLGEVKW